MSEKVQPMIEKHQRFLDKFEREGKQIAKAIKQPRKKIFGNVSTPKL